MPHSNNTQPNNNGQLMMLLGQLTGEVRSMHTGIVARMEDMRRDMARSEAQHKADLAHAEERLNRRIDGIGGRVTALEGEDKRMIEKVAKFSAAGGSVGGIIAAAAIEFFKILK